MHYLHQIIAIKDSLNILEFYVEHNKKKHSAFDNLLFYLCPVNEFII